MDIIVQIKTIIFSFLFGIFFSIMLGLNYKYITGSRKFLSIILTFMFVIVNVLLYFIIMKKINDGIFHQYEVLFIILGFLFENLIYRLVYKKLKKWYTLVSKVGDDVVKKKNKKSKRRLAFLGPICIFIIGYFIFNSFYYFHRIMVLEKSKAELEKQLVLLQEKEENLTSDIQKLKDPEYIARYARENYMYSMDGEYIIKIDDDNSIIDESDSSFDYKYLFLICTVGAGIIVFYIIKRVSKKRN